MRVTNIMWDKMDLNLYGTQTSNLKSNDAILVACIFIH